MPSVGEIIVSAVFVIGVLFLVATWLMATGGE